MGHPTFVKDFRVGKEDMLTPYPHVARQAIATIFALEESA
jgi:hypothetical protein